MRALVVLSPKGRLQSRTGGSEVSLPSPGVAAGILISYAPITVEGSIVTPGPCVEEIAIFFR
jgi:hypothetical protein